MMSRFKRCNLGVPVLMVAATLAALPTARANIIKVSVGNGSISFVDDTNKNSPYTIYVRTGWGPGGVTPINQGLTNSSGESGTGNIAGREGLTFEIDIGGEHFIGITSASEDGQDMQSLEQKNGKVPPTQVKSNGLPFNESYSTFFVGQSGLADQFELVNSSTDTGYLISALKLYRGLNSAFFTPGSFDSPEAIASGELYRDIIAGTGSPIQLFQGGGPQISAITAVVEPVAMSGYQLMIGTASPVLPDGTLGAPTDFAVANLFVPEPSTLVLSALGGVGLLGLALRRRKSGVRTAL